MSPGGICFTPGAVTHSVFYTAVRRLGQDKCYLTGWNGGAVDLVSPSSKISQRLYCSLKVHKEGGEERLAAVQRLQGLRGERRDEERKRGRRSVMKNHTQELNLTPPTLHLRLMQAKVHTLSLLLGGNAILI